jgi:hypothetical protein
VKKGFWPLTQDFVSGVKLSVWMKRDLLYNETIYPHAPQKEGSDGDEKFVRW